MRLLVRGSGCKLVLLPCNKIRIEFRLLNGDDDCGVKLLAKGFGDILDLQETNDVHF